ncbi:hypothetical protein BH11PSE9_BH11PSE9_00350 [soil metagenome]
MNKQALMAFLAALTLFGSAHANAQANAQAIPFFDVKFEATSIALTSDGPAGFDAQSGLRGADTVSSSADSIGLIDVATAGAIVGSGLLSTSADVSAAGLGSAVATSRFTGSFLNAGAVSLALDFTSLDFATGSGGAMTTLFVSLTSNGITLFEDYVHGPWQFAYTPLLGTTSLLDLTLSSEASAAFLTAGPGNASAFGLVAITGAVPEPSTWLLFGIGMGAVVIIRTRAQRRSALV